MVQKKIALEYKYRDLDRPTLDGIVGAQIRAVPDASEIIIRCRSVTRRAYEAANLYGIKITIVPREQTPNNE